MRISDWSSDVCSSDLSARAPAFTMTHEHSNSRLDSGSFPPACQPETCECHTVNSNNGDETMQLYQVNLPGSAPVMVLAFTMQRAWVMAFSEYAHQCAPAPAVPWPATEERISPALGDACGVERGVQY